MEPSSEDPHLCWTTQLLGLTSFLLSTCSTVVQSSGKYVSEAQDSGFVPMQGIRGGSVLFHIVKKQETDPEEVSWGFGPESNYSVFLRVRHGADTPTWVSLQDKYQQRVHVPNATSLRIENLTPEDSGQYRARASFTGGREFTQVFLLTVYEPVILPEIWVKSSSITPGWCNVTLDCRAPGNREGLNVTWESEGLPRELEWSGTQELAPRSWSLHVNLSLSQPNASLTCVVSNHVDKKTATVDFGKVCFPGSQEQTIAGPLEGILWAVVAVLFFLGIGLYFWKTYKKRNTETGRGAALQEDHRNQDDGNWAEQHQEEYQEGMYQSISAQYLEQELPLNTVYSAIQNIPARV